MARKKAASKVGKGPVLKPHVKKATPLKATQRARTPAATARRVTGRRVQSPAHTAAARRARTSDANETRPPTGQQVVLPVSKPAGSRTATKPRLLRVATVAVPGPTAPPSPTIPQVLVNPAVLVGVAHAPALGVVPVQTFSGANGE